MPWFSPVLIEGSQKCFNIFLKFNWPTFGQSNGVKKCQFVVEVIKYFIWLQFFLIERIRWKTYNRLIFCSSRKTNELYCFKRIRRKCFGLKSEDLGDLKIDIVALVCFCNHIIEKVLRNSRSFFYCHAKGERSIPFEIKEIKERNKLRELAMTIQQKFVSIKCICCASKCSVN